MAFIVPPTFKAYIYLDTNILEDYLEKTYPLLNKCIDFLSQCPFVTLHASHYVEYELTEVRKLRLFEHMVDPYSEPNRKEQASIKANWVYKGHKYEKYKDVIKRQVMDEIDDLKFNHNISFDDNVLHDDLLNPVKELALSSTISREDSMVMTSAVFPDYNVYIKKCALISADSQFVDSIKKCNSEVKKTMDGLGTDTPVFLYAKQLRSSFFSKKLNLYKDDSSEDVESFMKKVVLDLICEMNAKTLFATTTHYTPKGKVSRYLYLKMLRKEKELKYSDGLIIVPKDLSFFKVIQIDASTYKHKGKAITIPYKWSLCPNFSVEIIKTDDETYNLVNTNGCFVFYEYF